MGKYIDDKTFYDILNIDAASIPVDKQEAENFIRNAYKDKERTAEVNLAYSVLKNFRLRDAYNWWLKHSEWVSVIQQFDIETVDVAEDEAEIRRALELAEVRVRESG
ncbi:MAG: hypothetical protein H0M93_05560 [Methanophagales archaeon]|nr:hypothetical protein [Methanophagales archaeon]